MRKCIESYSPLRGIYFLFLYGVLRQGEYIFWRVGLLVYYLANICPKYMDFKSASWCSQFSIVRIRFSAVVRSFHRKLFSFSGRNQLLPSSVQYKSWKSWRADASLAMSPRSCTSRIPIVSWSQKLHGVVGHLSVVKLDMTCHEWFTVVPDRLPLRIQPKMAGSTTNDGEALLGFSHFTT